MLLCSACYTLAPTTGSMPSIKAFAAAVFGGIGSIPGALPGGLLPGLIEIMAKVYQPTKGTILLDGRDTHGMSTAQVNRAGVARTFQNIRLFQALSVEDNVKVGMDAQMRCGMWSGISRLPRYRREEAVAHQRAMASSLFGMEHLANAKAG